MYLNLSFNEILSALILAFFITIFIRFLSKIKIVREYSYNEKILEKFVQIFSKEEFEFKGIIYKKGMNIKITTINGKTHEGELVGFNYANNICIKTRKSLIIYDFKEVDKISTI